ncbi:hypothetical protein BC835DRAFT_1425189 [Cytidiella melzeri]|nr:hypothetical protein BC835DRAFT_1425189 [Cytidiella melzeri]
MCFSTSLAVITTIVIGTSYTTAAIPYGSTESHHPTPNNLKNTLTIRSAPGAGLAQLNHVMLPNDMSSRVGVILEQMEIMMAGKEASNRLFKQLNDKTPPAANTIPYLRLLQLWTLAAVKGPPEALSNLTENNILNDLHTFYKYVSHDWADPEDKQRIQQFGLHKIFTEKLK